MNLSKKNLIFSISVCFFLWIQVSSSPAQNIDWQQDIELAKQLAVKENKLILLHFTADWCRPCRNLETFVFTSPIVHNAIDVNAVPVKIDVDLHADLVKEYAISGVPSDVVITPAGRIVTRRNSPSTIDGYARMLNSLENTVDELAEGEPSLKQSLAELQEQLAPRTQEIAEHNQFEPKPPSHFAPKTPMHGAKMMRSRAQVLANPFIEKEREGQASIKIANDFVPNEEVALKSNDFPDAGTNSFSSPNSIARAVIVKSPSDKAEVQSPAPRAQALAKIKQQPVQNQFIDRPLAKQSVAQSPTIGPESLVAQQQFAPSDKLDEAKSKAPVVQQDRSEFALHGKCPVTLMMASKWVDGNKEWGCVHRGRTYLFTSQLHLREFQKDPDKFSPLLAGYDPVIYHDQGLLVDGREENGVFMGKLENQRIILFSSDESRAKFQSSPEKYINTVRQAMRSTANRGETKMR